MSFPHWINIIPKGYDKKYALGSRMRAGVRCSECGWKAYRILWIKAGIGQAMSQLEIDKLIKGDRCTPNCPRCRGPVVYTHVTDGIRA